MPTIEINDATVYYQSCGDDQPNPIPIILIHQSTVDSHTDWVAREAPDWMNQMISLHAEVNGQDYWRDLLWLTMKEIISEPNYSPAALARVERPTLVIMGAEDDVNAHDEHAQYIANNIPDAELWIPEKTGHNVHWERREEWIARVMDFLERRGLSFS